MKTKKTLALALALSMVFSLFCSLPSASAEEAEDGTPATAAVTPAYETFNADYFTGGTVYSLANNSNLVGMKYFYYYVNYNGSGNQGPTIRIFETSTGGGGSYFPKNESNTLIRAVTMDGTPKSWQAGGANKLNFPADWTSFEGYVILSIEDNLYAGWSGDSIEGLDMSEISGISIEAMNDATSVGDFGFARSYADAVNAVSGKLNKYYDTEKVAPLTAYSKSFNTTGEQEVPVYQNTDGSYTDKKWAGFYVKADNWFNFNLALVENNNAWWWINDNTEKKYYYLTADGTCTEYSNSNNHGFDMYSAFADRGRIDGYIIFNTGELVSDTNPAYTGNGDATLSLDSLKSIKLFSVSGGTDFLAKPEYTVGNVALATDKEALVEYYTSRTEATAVTLNSISNTVKANDNIQGLNDADLTSLKSGYIGFYLNKNNANNFSMLFHEKEAAGKGGYWANGVGKTLFVTKDGISTYVSNGGNFGMSIPEGFTEGYVVIDPSVFTTHPGYKDNGNEAFDINAIDRLQIVTADSEMKIQYLSVAENGNELLAHLKAEVAGGSTDNVDIINAAINTRTKSTEVDVNNTEISVKAYDYYEDSTAEMKYVGFRFKTNGNYGNIMLGFVEENGAMYWRAERATYYFVDKSTGKLSEGNTRTQSAGNYPRPIYSEGAFDGYIIIPLSSLEGHTGHAADSNGRFDTASLKEIRHWGLQNTDIELGNFAFGTDMASLVDYLANADTEAVSLLGDANGDSTLDIRDLIRMKKYLTNSEAVEARENAIDMNRDGKKDSLDLAALRKYLLLEK